MENQKNENNKNEESQDDLYSMRSKMNEREDAPNAEEEKGGLLKNIGKIFTRKLAPIETSTQDSLNQEPDDIPIESHPINAFDQNDSMLKSNETKALPDLDEEEISTPSGEETGEQNKRRPSLIDLIEDTPSDENKKLPLNPPFRESSPTSKNTFKLNPLAETPFEEMSDLSKTKPLPDIDNDDFVKKVTASLKEDLEYLDESTTSSPPKPINNFLLDDLLVKDIENEIDHADEATNPFVTENESENDDDFISRLEDMFSDKDATSNVRTKPLTMEDGFTEFIEDEHSLSRESWEQVFNATQETNPATTENNKRLLIEGSQKGLLSTNDDEKTTYEQMISSEDEANNLDLNELKIDDQSSDSKITLDDDGDLNTLRQSFIEEFEHSPWNSEEEEAEENKSWFVRKWKEFKTWVKSLSTAEKILMFLSIVISISVLIAISMVAFEWNLNRNVTSAPPETLEVLSDMEIYPTGLQLPGGWFFFLQQGQIQQSGSIGKWEPEGAEWLAGTTIRRVVAIPWSKQAEAVALSLETGDEIRLFLNNNEVSSFYVEEIKYIEYDNVRDTMIDTQPSLAVILFRDDKADRLVIIARP